MPAIAGNGLGDGAMRQLQEKVLAGAA